LSAVQHSAAVRSRPLISDWRHLVTSAAWTALVAFVVVAVLLAVRRLAGAIAHPIPGPMLFPLATGIAMASVLVRLWLIPQTRSPARGSTGDWLVLAVPSLALVVLLVALFTPGTSLPAALAALLFAAVIEGLFWRHIAVMLRPRETASRPSPEIVPERVEEFGEEESYPPNLLQQIVRTRQGSGEAIHAVLRAEFQPGEQVQVLHVAFCPPLADAPQLEAFAVGDLSADVKVTSAYNFGARLEVQLELPATEAASVLVEVTSR
jgi:hypothetical protein